MKLEHKFGIAISCTFLCLVGAVIGLKMQKKANPDSQSMAAVTPHENDDQIPLEPKPISPEDPDSKPLSKGDKKDPPPPASGGSSKKRSGIDPASLLEREPPLDPPNNGGASPSGSMSNSGKDKPPKPAEAAKKNPDSSTTLINGPTPGNQLGSGNTNTRFVHGEETLSVPPVEGADQFGRSPPDKPQVKKENKPAPPAPQTSVKTDPIGKKPTPEPKPPSAVITQTGGTGSLMFPNMPPPTTPTTPKPSSPASGGSPTPTPPNKTPTGATSTEPSMLPVFPDRSTNKKSTLDPAKKDPPPPPAFPPMEKKKDEPKLAPAPSMQPPSMMMPPTMSRPTSPANSPSNTAPPPQGMPAPFSSSSTAPIPSPSITASPSPSPAAPPQFSNPKPIPPSPTAPPSSSMIAPPSPSSTAPPLIPIPTPTPSAPANPVSTPAPISPASPTPPPKPPTDGSAFIPDRSSPAPGPVGVRPAPLPLPTPPSAPLTTAQDKPIAPRPASSAPNVTVYEEQDYTCQPGDTWASISKRILLSDRYAKALQRHNQNHARASERMKDTGQIAAGERIFVPQAYVLEQRYGDAIVRPTAPTPTTMPARYDPNGSPQHP